jgi:hypothetical protein
MHSQCATTSSLSALTHDDAGDTAVSQHRTDVNFACRAYVPVNTMNTKTVHVVPRFLNTMNGTDPNKDSHTSATQQGFGAAPKIKILYCVNLI